MTEDGIKILQSLPVSHVYDLRSKNEIERNKTVGFGGVKEWNGCQRVFVPVFRDMDYRPEKVALRYKDYASESTEVVARETCLDECIGLRVSVGIHPRLLRHS